MFQATVRNLEGYLQTRYMEIVDDSYEPQSCDVVLIETNEDFLYWECRTPNALARFSFRDKYTQLEAAGERLIELKSYCNKSLIGSREIAMPLLASRLTINNCNRVDPGKRKYFATFKGTIFQDGKPGDVRTKLLDIHNGSDVIVVPLRHKFDEYTEDQDKAIRCSDDYDYVDLMDSEFGLVPGGRQPATYRLIECLAYNVIPIVFESAARLILPFQDKIDWKKISLIIDSDEVSAEEVIELARQIDDEAKASFRAKGAEVFFNFFSSHSKAVESVVSLYSSRFIV